MYVYVLHLQTFIRHLTIMHMYDIYIYIYIYIYICMVKKTHDLFKSTNISVLFRSFINVKSNYQITNKNTNKSATI